MYSKIVFVLSWAAAAFAFLATTWWLWSVYFVDYNFLFDVVFTLFTAPVNLGVLFLAVIPSSVLYSRTRERRDLTSLLLSGISFVVVLVLTILIWTVITLHGA